MNPLDCRTRNLCLDRRGMRRRSPNRDAGIPCPFLLLLTWGGGVLGPDPDRSPRSLGHGCRSRTSAQRHPGSPRICRLASVFPADQLGRFRRARCRPVGLPDQRIGTSRSARLDGCVRANQRRSVTATHATLGFLRPSVCRAGNFRRVVRLAQCASLSGGEPASAGSPYGPQLFPRVHVRNAASSRPPSIARGGGIP